MWLSYKEHFFITDSLDGDTAREECRGAFAFLGHLESQEEEEDWPLSVQESTVSGTDHEIFSPHPVRLGLTERRYSRVLSCDTYKLMLAFPA